MRAYIDLGHGEHGDPGAVSGNYVEHPMNIVTGNACAERLIQRGWEVLVEQGDLEIGDSARAGNAFGANILLSFHYNAGGGDRGEVIYSWKSGSLELANVVAQGIKNVGQQTVNVYQSKAIASGTAEYFGILRISTMAGVIIEPCFLDNSTDITLADSVEEQKNIGYAIADAVADYYGGEDMEKTTVKLNGNTIGNGYFDAVANRNQIPVGLLIAELSKIGIVLSASWDEPNKTINIIYPVE